MRPVVSLRQCQDYDRRNVDRAVGEAITLLGGIERFVQAGQRVVLKVNLLRSSAPERAIVTHPAIVRAVAQQVISAGGIPIIADSPAGPFNQGSLRKVYQQAGLTNVAEETGALLNFDTAATTLSHPTGKLIKRFEIINAIVEADAIITLPKLKTHALTGFTGGTKILFGAIPGLTKMGYHAKLADVAYFSEMLLDLLTLLKPSLAIMDGVIGMEGNGPSGGSPRPMGAVIASSDSVALDVVACGIAGLDLETIPIIRTAVSRGLSTGKVDDIDVLGAPFAEMIVRGFKPGPNSSRDFSSLPGFLRHWVTRQIVVRPAASANRCTGCATCQRNCPVDAITMVNHLAIMDHDKCLRCYCCHEVCPENAIDLKQGWLAQLLSRN